MSIDEAEVLEHASTASVTRARSHTDNVEWSAMDATRTEHDFLCRCVEAAIKAGATTVNIPDTVGYATPEEFAALIRMIVERVPNSDKAVFSTHCHNDLGLAVANSLFLPARAGESADGVDHDESRRDAAGRFWFHPAEQIQQRTQKNAAANAGQSREKSQHRADEQRDRPKTFSHSHIIRLPARTEQQN